MEGELFIHLAALAAAVLFGHFIGYRSGWNDYSKKMRKDAETAISAAAEAAAGVGRQQHNPPPSLMPAADPKNPPPVPVGQRFTYLGLQMICVAHAIRMPLGVLAPGMSAEYIDVDGIVRGHYWTPEQLDAVRAELQRAGSYVAGNS